MAAPGERRVWGDGKDEGHGGRSHILLRHGAARVPEFHGDATWGKVQEPSAADDNTLLREVPADTYSLVVTRSGGAVLTRAKSAKVLAAIARWRQSACRRSS